MIEYMPNHVSLPQWMPLLRQLWPCHTAVLVDIAKADTSLLTSIRYAHLQGLIAEHDGLVPFYQLSFPVENGLLPAQALKSGWPNIKDVRVEMVEAISLDTALKKYESDAGAGAAPISNWLWLTSMPALALMRGAKNCLTQLDVILARVMLQPDAPIEAGLMNLVHYLEYNGFVLVGVESERNPAFGTALFVRNHKAELQQKLEAETRAKAEVQQKLSAETQAKQAVQAKLDAEVKAMANSKAQVVQLSQDKATLQTQKEAEAKAEALASRDAQQKLATEHQAALDVANKAQVDLRHKLDAEIKSKDELRSNLESEKRNLIDANNKEKKRQLEISQLQKLNRNYEELNQHLEMKIKKYSATSMQSIESSGSDDNIGAFISDISIFFSGKKVTYVDIGACIGDVFFGFLKKSKISIREAHLVEPNPDNFEVLVEKCESIQNIAMCNKYNLAIHETLSSCRISKNKTMSRVLDLNDDAEAANSAKISAIRLDKLADQVTDRKIQILKIDVEGSEMSVLRSGASLFEKQLIDVIYIEVGLNKDGVQQVYFAEVDGFMQNYGYRIFGIYEARHEWLDDLPLLRRCNIAYMRHGFAASNPCHLLKQNISFAKTINISLS